MMRFVSLRSRVIEPELLDGAEPEEARRNLQQLVQINRQFGGHGVIKRVLDSVVDKQECFTLLDIGAASGDTARLIQKKYPGARVTSLDHSATNISDAPFPKLIANAFELPFRERSFDYVFCSLFLHHFTDEQVVQLLRQFYAVARKALLVCDLERHILSYLFLPATALLFGWEPITLHDGPISVRAAFKAHELRESAEKAGIIGPRVSVYRPAFRVALVAKK